jgi:hypothetical protein
MDSVEYSDSWRLKKVDGLWLIVDRRRSQAALGHQLPTINYQPVFSFFPPSPSRICGTIGRGKSYPVTAAQLLPVFTGFLAPIHFSSSQRTEARTTSLRFSAQDLFIPTPL